MLTCFLIQFLDYIKNYIYNGNEIIYSAWNSFSSSMVEYSKCIRADSIIPIIVQLLLFVCCTQGLNNKRSPKDQELKVSNFNNNEIKNSVSDNNINVNGLTLSVENNTGQILLSKDKYAIMGLDENYSEFGPGEMGAPFYLENPTPQQSELIAEGYRTNGFNQYISDMISFNRTLPDYRSSWCQKPNLHSRHLLPSSVVICFHNEAWSTLIRTIHSVLDRTPARLLSDIILVDDFSSQEHLKEVLDEYVKKLPKLRLLRLRKREGLIRARLIGASNAEGPIVSFLDSNIEVTEGWLEPLVDRITRNNRTVICPVVDSIDANTFEYRTSNISSTTIGRFLWTLQFRWDQASDEILKNLRSPDEPLPTPVMGHGMFSIHKKFLETLGWFDDGAEIWGGENIEISFKTWMCGGRVEISPCSHIGHISRNRVPYEKNGIAKYARKNLARVAAVWMDEPYASYHFSSYSTLLEDFGDVSERIELKKRLKCRDFDWYMNNVAIKSTNYFNPKNSHGEGEIRSLAFGAVNCLDSPETSENIAKVLIWPCHNLKGNQHWYFTDLGEFRRGELCLDYNGIEIVMFPCHKTQGNQQWDYQPKSGFMKHELTGKCLELEELFEIRMSECDEKITQRWQLEHYYQDKINDNHNKRSILKNKRFKYLN